MERISRKRQHLGTHRTITRFTITKGISFPPPASSYKNPTDPTSNSSPSFHLEPHSKLEFHPYAYLNFCIPSSFPNTPCMSMSELSVNPSNESPTSTPPHSPTLQILFNPVATTTIPTYPLLSPQTALNILATQPDLNDTV